MEKQSKTLFITLAIVVVVGFLAGVVGELWLNSFLLPDPYLNFKNYSDLSSKIDELIKGQSGRLELSQIDNIIDGAVRKARPAIVGIYHYKFLGDKASATLADADFAAAGAIVTSDGWILTGRQAVASEKEKFWVVTDDRRVFQTEKVLLENSLGLAMLKINAADLSVAEFSLRQELVDGQSALLFGAGKNVAAATIGDKLAAKLASANDYVHGSEQFYKFVRLSAGVENEFVGGPLITLDGKMAGLILDKTGLAAPMDHLVSFMKSATEGSKWRRPYLGIKFYDLSEVLNPSVTDKRGALISAHGIAPNSPAKNDFLPGDIILKVENEELNVNKNLSEILVQYKPGTTVKLLIKRGVEEKTISVIF